MTLSRRDMLFSSLGLGVAFAAGPCLARGNWAVPSTFGIMPARGTGDQTSMLQEAIDAAAKSRTPLFLPPGIYSTRRLELRSGTHLTGVPGKSILRCCDGKVLIGVEQAQDIRLNGLVLDGCGQDMGIDGALFAATTVKRLHLSSCLFLRSGSGAILVSRSENVVIDGNMIDRAATGIAVANGTKGGEPVRIQGNLVRNLFFRKIAVFHGNGITVEVDAMVTGNVVENAPGFGILVGRDVRDLSIAKNDIRNAHIGIGIPAAIVGTAPIAGNGISGVKDGAIRAMSGPTPVGPDLADRYATS